MSQPWTFNLNCSVQLWTAVTPGTVPAGPPAWSGDGQLLRPTWERDSFWPRWIPRLVLGPITSLTSIMQIMPNEDDNVTGCLRILSQDGDTLADGMYFNVGDISLHCYNRAGSFVIDAWFIALMTFPNDIAGG